ncbi:6378_t:CDS:2, partial [Scutellospora calospora]
PIETRWNSYYYCFSSLLKTKAALKATKFELSSTSSSMQNTSLSTKICDIINNKQWWITINNLANLLLPYCAILNKLQQDKARLHERWKSWEQPLLLLAFLLHPEYRIQIFESSIEGLYTQLSDWICWYYYAWFQAEPKSLLPELEKFRKQQKLFTSRVEDQFANDILGYWEFCSDSAKELSKVACRIFSICVNSACVERLFSCMGWFHNKYRNRLKPNKVLQMSQLRAAINHHNNLKAIKSSIETFQSNVQLLLPQSDNSEILIDPTQNQDYTIVVSDSEDEETQNQNNNIMNVEEWNKTISKWVTMIDDDEYSRSEEEWDQLNSVELELDENIINSNQVVSNIIIDHPSINKDAKWNLCSLFSQNLPTPPYFLELE